VFFLLQADYFAVTGREAVLDGINIHVVCKGFVTDESKSGWNFVLLRSSFCFVFSSI
jgi:hypothetical protein